MTNLLHDLHGFNEPKCKYQQNNNNKYLQSQRHTVLWLLKKPLGVCNSYWHKNKGRKGEGRWKKGIGSLNLCQIFVWSNWNVSIFQWLLTNQFFKNMANQTCRVTARCTYNNQMTIDTKKERK